MAQWLVGGFLLVAFVAAIVAPVAMSRGGAFTPRRRVMVNLVDGKAISGVLWSRRARLLVLKDATLHERGVDPTTVDGEVLVDRHRVDFVQVL